MKIIETRVTGQKKLTFKFDFPGNLCKADFVILRCFVFRMLRLCHYDRNEKGNREKTFTCDCGATLITSLHALTSFWCIHDWDKESGCEKTDFSNGEEDWLIA